jgi:hypothetical protein
VPPRLAWKLPGLPREWVLVLERHPEPMGLAGHGDPLSGYVWLDTPGKVLHAAEHLLESAQRRPKIGKEECDDSGLGVR